MPRVGLLLTLVALPALAVSNLDVGSEHRLIGATVVQARLASAGERLRLSVRSEPAAAVTVTLRMPDQTTRSISLSSGAPGWLALGTAPLVLTVPVGVTAISFSVPNVLPADARYDIDIAVIDATTAAVRTGRVFSLQWEFDAGSYVRLTNVAFYARVPFGAESVVWQLALAGLAGWQFQVLSNRVGVEPPSSARSVSMVNNRLLAEYEVYLEPPDVVLSAQAAGVLEGVAQLADGLRVANSSPGTLSIDVDLDRDGVAPSSPRERFFSVRVPAGGYDVTLGWRDGLGQPLPPGAFTGYATLASDELHFTAVDVEYCLPGVRLFQLTDAGLQPELMSWDDTAVDDGTIPRPFASNVSSGDPLQPAQAGLNAHGWGGPLGNAEGPGNRSFIDTWASGRTRRVSFPVVTGAALDTLPRRDEGAQASMRWVTSRVDAGVASSDAGDSMQPDAGTEPDVGAGLAPVMEVDGGAPGPAAPGFTGGGGCSSAPSSLLGLALLVWRRRRLAALCGVLVAGRALAFDSETLTPLRLSTPRPTLIGTEVRPGEVALTTSYSRNPVLLGGTPVVSDLSSTWLAGSLRVAPSLALEGGLGVLIAPAGTQNTLWRGARVSDGLLGVRWRVGEVGPLSFALHAHGRIPLALKPDFVAGAFGALAGSTVQLDFGRVQLTADLTGALLTARRSHVRGQLGGAVRAVSSLWVGVEADVLGYLQPRTDVLAPVPVEARASLRWVGPLLSVGVVGGVGLDHGVGAPEARVLVSVSFAFPDFAEVSGRVGAHARSALPLAPREVLPPAPSVTRAASLRHVSVRWDDGRPAAGATLSVPCRSQGNAEFECALEGGAIIDVTAPGAYPTKVRVSSAEGLEVSLSPLQPGFRVDATSASLDLDVFFETASDALSASARSRLDQLASRLASSAAPVAVISAHADARGAQGDNLVLSWRRGEAVKAYLRARGITVPLVVEPRGESDARMGTGSATELETDRRVHVALPSRAADETPAESLRNTVFQTDREPAVPAPR